MSVVVNILTPKDSWLFSDGRVSSAYGKILSESQKKITRMNSNVIIGFTGVLEIAQKVLTTFQETSPDISHLFCGQVAARISNLVSCNASQTLYAQFLVTGIDYTGSISTYAINRTGGIEPIYPVQRSFVTTVLGSDKAHDLKHMLDSELRKNLAVSPDHIAVALAVSSFVSQLAASDPTVNTNLSLLEIHRPTK